MMTTITHQFHAIVYGLVQGVSFRYYTQQTAIRLGIVGWVRNLSNGTVEVLAEGSKSTLEHFIAFLQQGPTHAVVENVELSWGTPSFQYKEFLVMR